MKGIGKKQWIAVGSILVIGFLLVIIVVFYITPKKRLQSQLDMGNRYLEEMDYEQAIAAYEVALSIDEKCVGAYLGSAEAYIALGNYKEAIAVLEQGQKLTGDERITEKLEELRGYNINADFDIIDLFQFEGKGFADWTVEELKEYAENNADEHLDATQLDSSLEDIYFWYVDGKIIYDVKTMSDGCVQLVGGGNYLTRISEEVANADFDAIFEVYSYSEALEADIGYELSEFPSDNGAYLESKISMLKNCTNLKKFCDFFRKNCINVLKNYKLVKN